MLAHAQQAIEAGNFIEEGRWAMARTRSGRRSLRWVWTGMPRIPSDYLKSTVYLYRSVEDAEAGREGSGTGFIVGIPISSNNYQCVLYVVTNCHVACRGSSVIRVNLAGGRFEVVDLGPEDWTFKAGSHDVAIAPLPRSGAEVDIRFIPVEQLVTDLLIASRNIGPGEDVFMIGRFVDAGGIQSNQPAVRFGNISMMPVPIKQVNGATVDSYAIDMHSRSGFSGSPVFVFRKSGQDLSSGDLNMADQFLLLLGIHWGQFPERWDIVADDRAAAEEAGEVSLKADSRYISGMSGMTCVAPASAILDLLQHPKLQAVQEKNDREARSLIAMDFSMPVLEPNFRSSDLLQGSALSPRVGPG